MKILFIPTSYPSEKNPTTNLFVREQAEALQKKNHEIRVLHVEQYPTKKVFTKMDRNLSVIDDHGIVRYNISSKTFFERKLSNLNRFLFCRKMKFLFEYMIKEWKPDIIYAHFSNWAGDIAVDLGKEYHIPVVTIEHFSGFMSNMFTKCELKGLKKCVNYSDKMLCVSDNFQNKIIYLTNSKKKPEVLYNMISPEFKYSPREKKSDFVFCAVGNLNKRKRFDLLIQAFCTTFSPTEKVKLIIGGNGNQKEKLHKLILKHKRGHQITMIGSVNRQETVDLYKKCDVFVLPSSSETFGIVWREAMAVGRPIITTNHGGFLIEKWDPKIGYIIPVDSIFDLKNALREIYININSFDGEYISKQCLALYSEEVIVNKLIKIFKDVIERSNDNE